MPVCHQHFCLIPLSKSECPQGELLRARANPETLGGWGEWLKSHPAEQQILHGRDMALCISLVTVSASTILNMRGQRPQCPLIQVQDHIGAEGSSALSVACRSAHRFTVQLLLREGASPFLVAWRVSSPSFTHAKQDLDFSIKFTYQLRGHMAPSTVLKFLEWLTKPSMTLGGAVVSSNPREMALNFRSPLEMATLIITWAKTFWRWFLGAAKSSILGMGSSHVTCEPGAVWIPIELDAASLMLVV